MPAFWDQQSLGISAGRSSTCSMSRMASDIFDVKGAPGVRRGGTAVKLEMVHSLYCDNRLHKKLSQQSINAPPLKNRVF